MKRIIIGGLAISVLLTAAALSVARAADMAVKAPPIAAAPVAAASWTGFYIDGVLGWQRNSYTWNENAPGGPFDSIFSMSKDDGSFGGHAGYQQQFGSFVLGVEGGLFKSFSGRFASTTSVGAANGPCDIAVAGSLCEATLGTVSTYGGKVGYAWSDWLLYGDGGGAHGSGIKTQVILPSGALGDFTNAQGHTGWYAGGGLDYMLVKGKLLDVILGVEYEHADLGAVQEFDNINGGPGVFQRAITAKVDAIWGKLTFKINPWSN